MDHHAGAGQGGLTTTIELEVLGVSDSPKPAQRAALVVYHGAHSELIPLTAGAPVTVGRDSPSDVTVDDPSVSRQHARFDWQNGSVVVDDLDSRNGTLVNGVRVRQRTIVPGDRVQVGAATILLAQVAAEPALPPSDEPLVVGQKLRGVYEQATVAAGIDVPALVLGETGTGKDHVARLLHSASARKGAPFIVVNCSTLPANLVESALFGHERGAFTGAAQRHAGVFERAANGVLFLDEIGDLSLDAQPALLRVLEGKPFTRVGGTAELKPDVRVVAATHCDLAAMVEEGTFRRDLYYRLNTFVIDVPPLRDRREEIVPLVEHFRGLTRVRWNAKPTRFSEEVLALLLAYDWPGNVRQLRNVVERAVLIANGETVRHEHLPRELLNRREPPPEQGGESEEGLKDRLRKFEADALRATLARTGGNRSAAARILRMPTASLFRRLKELGVE